jgi:hypothetical protein
MIKIILAFLVFVLTGCEPGTTNYTKMTPLKMGKVKSFKVRGTTRAWVLDNGNFFISPNTTQVLSYKKTYYAYITKRDYNSLVCAQMEPNKVGPKNPDCVRVRHSWQITVRSEK